MNLRPSGYEPDELPGCSTPHQVVRDEHCVPRPSDRVKGVRYRRGMRAALLVIAGIVDGAHADPSKLLRMRGAGL